MKQVSLTIVTAFICIGLFLLPGCSKSSGYGSNSGGGGGGNNQPNTIKMKGSSFSPATLTVSAGTTVYWSNDDNMTHTVTADDASFDSGDIPVGGTYNRTFAIAATIQYHCARHGGMTGSVKVN